MARIEKLKEHLTKNSIALTLLGLGLFGISFFLPSFKTSHFDGAGWECAKFCLEVLMNDSPRELNFWYYGLFNLSNLAMVVMPILLLTVLRKRAVPFWIVIVQGILLLHVISWPIRVLIEGGGTVRIGYYQWLISMIIIFGISLCRASSGSGATPDSLREG